MQLCHKEWNFVLQNFIKNIARNQFDLGTIEAVWDRLEGEWKSQAELMKAQEKPADKPNSKTNGENTNGVQNGHQAEENGEETSKKRKKDKKNKRKREEMEDNDEEVKKQKCEFILFIPMYILFL